MRGEVGVIGLGIMGGAMAGNLRERGWRVVGFDLDEGRRDELAGRGVEIAQSVADVARAAPTLITSLPSPAAVLAVSREIALARLPKRVVCETSTLALDDKVAAEKVFADSGHVLLDCPLSGTGAQAKNRDLVVYASGDSASIAGLQPLFADFARQAHDLGAFGNGTRMKFVANLLVAIHNLASAEAMVLAMKAGLDPRQVVEVVGAGAGGSRMFDMRAPLMVEDRYEPATMKISTWQKDMAVIGAFAAALGAPTPLFSATEPYYAAAMSQGRGNEDTAAVCAVLEAMAGMTRG
ncbi:NAD(P)-dependent oxidoreductase [Faunimonas sp. B44]|uniref:NAD(P)-dependent oxidoreductase n=1 Tax=Faunimonas sp. B44 TaxID=3461493 RepID=UPI004044FC0C